MGWGFCSGGAGLEPMRGNVRFSSLQMCVVGTLPSSPQDNKHSLNSYSSHHTVLGTTGDRGNTKEIEAISPAPKELV